MPSKKAKKLFAKSFAVSLAVMAALSVILLFDFGGENKTVPQSSSEVQIPFTPSAEDKFTLFVPISRGFSEPPYSYFLLSFSGGEDSISVACLPRQTVLSEDGESKVILGEIFEKNGVSAAQSALERFFGGEISAYILFDNDSLRAFFELFEPVRINVPQNLSQIDRERDIYIKIDKGACLLSPMSLVDYIGCTAFDGGINQSLCESSRALAAFLSQNAEALFSPQNDSCEQFVLNKTTTDISIVDLENRRELLGFLSLKDKAAKALETRGELKNADTEFVLTSLCRAQISDMLKR